MSSPLTMSLATCLNAPSGAGCSLTPASGSRVIATFPGAGSPPACGGPSGGGRNGSISTTFRWYDATRHRRPRERIRRRLWTRPCGKVAVRRGVPHHTGGDQSHIFDQPQPCGHPHVRPLPSPDPPVQAPVVERGRRAVDLHPSRTGDASSRIRPARGRSPTPSRTGHKTETDHVIRLLSTAPEQTLIVNPLIRGRSDVRRSLSAYDSRVASRIPSCATPAPTNKIVARAPHPHQYTQETPRSPQLDRVPFTPYVIASLREPVTDTRSQHEQVPFSRRISTVLASVARPGQRACGRPPPDSRQDPRPPS